ncbi:eukaryotic translation initiation factor 4B-like [Varroa destructor]|uniref:RRM domain-containing protein n=1 Tax=Varroa destructor TaxID=109461 RepID=A0A7M7JMA4_VARDE|nr:eukaryotic translation initiation factor 4B-like [Varroa destructor]
MSKKKMKGRTMELTDFLSEGGKPVQAGYTLVQKKIDWSDENNYTQTIHEMVLPTAPMSSRGGRVDDSKVPTEPPYTAYLGNLPFDIGEEEIANFFHELKISSIRLVTDSAKRPRGYGYAEFEDRRSLVEALGFDGDQLRNRPIKIGLASEYEDYKGPFGIRDRTGFGLRSDRNDRPERDLGTDWRASRREDPPMSRGYEDSRGYSRAGDRYGDRYGDRDRGGFGDRDREMSRDWRSSEGRGGFEQRDNRDRGGFGGRYEPPRDSRDYRGDDSGGPLERPKLNLAPRTKPVEPIKVIPIKADEPAPEPPRPKIDKPKNADIFGAAKPVDTAAREREIEAKLAAQAKEAAKEEEEREKERLAQVQYVNHENNNEPTPRSYQQPRQERSWRDESREEKEKRERDRKARADRRVAAPQQPNENETIVVTSRNKFSDLDDADGAPCESEGEVDEDHATVDCCK